MTKHRTKKCSKCLETKSIMAFWGDASKPDGKMSQCIACSSAAKTEASHLIKRGSGSGPQPVYTGGMSLDFLLKIRHKTAREWTIDEARHMLSLVQRAARKGPIKWKDVLSRDSIGKSVMACRSLIQELKEAAGKGYTLERYFSEDRPFRPKDKLAYEGDKKK